MPSLAVLPVVNPAIGGRNGFFLQVPGAAIQILGSAVFALIVVLAVTYVRQWRAARHRDKVLKAYAERDMARRREPAKHDQRAAPMRKAPPRRGSNSGGPNPH